MLGPHLGQCQIMELAGAEYFADWKDSGGARAAKEAEANAGNT
jgi:hypothetical protein